MLHPPWVFILIFLIFLLNEYVVRDNDLKDVQSANSSEKNKDICKILLFAIAIHRIVLIK